MNVEVQILRAVWIDGAPVTPEEGQPLPVFSLPRADAVYLQSIGRARLVEAEAPAEAPVEAPAKRKAKAD